MNNDMKILTTYIEALPDKPVDVVAAIKELGIEYIEAFLNGRSGMIERIENSSRYRITVNSSDSMTRKRFTAAHELGHYLFHRDLFNKKHIDSNIYSLERDDVVLADGERSLRPKHEIQANKFAANFLMPPKIVYELKRQGIVDSARLSKIFKVSEAAMRVRLGTYERPAASI